MQEVTVPGTPGDSSEETILTRRSPTVTVPGPEVPSLRFLRHTPSSLQFLSVRVGFYFFLFCFVKFCLSNIAARRENCPSQDQLSRVVSAVVPLPPSLLSPLSQISIAGGHSMPGQEEDISPYATFHLLGMREEAKAAAAGNNKMPTFLPPNPLIFSLTPVTPLLISRGWDGSRSELPDDALDPREWSSHWAQHSGTPEEPAGRSDHVQCKSTHLNSPQLSWESLRGKIFDFSLPAPTQYP